MLTITAFTVERIRDPFGILTGSRYEFRIELDVPEDDELYTENGLLARVVYAVEEDRSRIVKYELLEQSTERYLAFDLEDEELAEIETFCREHLADAEQS
ncbi:hypothetical protein J31TS4_04110 [Paenibacillus sp. J31TS4]|uniref:DUF6509 family protein n=1 Tax=Paenibacillus sp. J31TS4 TaxID=2807195 RepID=UPI001B291BE0|nr:DUF6509 family protein [Paenibacillus sp. J31TS4]GIP37131.1 hypothetical protein J31TS4_04110 [Paenibacillus sp. J31TS4]